MKYLLIIILLAIPMASGAVEVPKDALFKMSMVEPKEKQTLYSTVPFVGGEVYYIGYCPDAL